MAKIAVIPGDGIGVDVTEEAVKVLRVAEPQFEVRYIKTAAEGSGARSATLDPLGVELPVGKEAYASMLWSLASTMAECLGTDSE